MTIARSPRVSPLKSALLLAWPGFYFFSRHSTNRKGKIYHYPGLFKKTHADKTKPTYTYFPDDEVVMAAVIAMLVSVSSEPVDDFLVRTPVTLLLSITVDVLRVGGELLALTAVRLIQIIPINHLTLSLPTVPVYKFSKITNWGNYCSTAPQ